MQKSNRREFLKSSTVAAGASAVAMPAIAASAESAGDRLRVAVVGLGGRGRKSICGALLELAAKGENVEIAALSDCDELRLDSAADECEQLSGKRPRTEVDYRRLLEDASLDGVCLVTPNHWHALETIWACQAGKDVYVEKPGSHNVFEGRKMVEAARKYDRIVQHGTQCRSSAMIREGIAKLKEGVIGRVYMARGIAFKYRAGGRNEIGPAPPEMHWDLWLGPAPEAPYNKLAVSRWRFLKDYGNGEIGDQGVHQLDIIRWGLGQDAHPTLVQSMGGEFLYDDDLDTPGQQTFACQYEDSRLMVTFETRNGLTNSEAGMGIEYPFVDHRNVVGVIFFGTEGYMIIPDYSSYHTFLGTKRERGPSGAVAGEPMMNADHVKNWLDAVRSRQRGMLNAEIAEGHLSSTMCHLANIAYATRRTLRFDPSAERFPDDEEANRLLTREYRRPWVVPEEV